MSDRRAGGDDSIYFEHDGPPCKTVHGTAAAAAGGAAR
jgi:hypothetical protein